MNELSTDVKTHVIITHSGGYYPITTEQNTRLEMVGLNDLIEIDGNKIKGSSIAEVMTVSKFYDTHPNKKPEPKKDDFAKYESLAERVPVEGLPSLIRGLKRAIDQFRAEGHEPVKALVLLDRYEKKMRLCNNP
jgi:hypothetical protein